jgi:hypothetical protein
MRRTSMGGFTSGQSDFGRIHPGEDRWPHGLRSDGSADPGLSGRLGTGVWARLPRCEDGLLTNAEEGVDGFDLFERVDHERGEGVGPESENGEGFLAAAESERLMAVAVAHEVGDHVP